METWPAPPNPNTEESQSFTVISIVFDSLKQSWRIEGNLKDASLHPGHEMNTILLFGS